MSVIRDLVNELQTAPPELLEEIELQTGRTIESGKISIHIIDEWDEAVLKHNGDMIGILGVDYAEPCLTFRGLNFE